MSQKGKRWTNDVLVISHCKQFKDWGTVLECFSVLLLWWYFESKPRLPLCLITVIAIISFCFYLIWVFSRIMLMCWFNRSRFLTTYNFNNKFWHAKNRKQYSFNRMIIFYYKREPYFTTTIWVSAFGNDICKEKSPQDIFLSYTERIIDLISVRRSI